MSKTEFSPIKHGFHFSNRFVNKLFHSKYIHLEISGRCGGMAYASLDYYFSNIPIPEYKYGELINGVPKDGSFLADYIYRRQIDSLLTTTSYKFITWTVASDHKTLFRKGVLEWTKKKEFQKLRNSIDSGKPVVLGLIGVNSIKNIGKNHQVVAYGYEYNPTNEDMLVYVYDVNSSGKEVKLTSNKSNPHFVASNGPIWRGFFVQNYRCKNPNIKV